MLIQRITIGFTGLLARLRTPSPWRSITEDYDLGKPPTTELGRVSAQFAPEGWV